MLQRFCLPYCLPYFTEVLICRTSVLSFVDYFLRCKSHQVRMQSANIIVFFAFCFKLNAFRAQLKIKQCNGFLIWCVQMFIP